MTSVPDSSCTTGSRTASMTYSDEGGSGIDTSSLTVVCSSGQTSFTGTKDSSSASDTWSKKRNEACWYNICDNAGNCTDSSSFIVNIQASCGSGSSGGGSSSGGTGCDYTRADPMSCWYEGQGSLSCGTNSVKLTKSSNRSIQFGCAEWDSEKIVTTVSSWSDYAKDYLYNHPIVKSLGNDGDTLYKMDDGSYYYYHASTLNPVTRKYTVYRKKCTKADTVEKFLDRLGKETINCCCKSGGY